MTDRELFEKALEALEQHSAIQHPQQRHYRDAAIDALRDRLAQPEQEPVAWLHRDSWGTLKLSQTMPPPVGAFPVYTAPQQEPVIDKSAATRIATALGWVPAGDTSQQRVDQAQKQRQEQEPVAWVLEWIEDGEVCASKLYESERRCRYDAKKDTDAVCRPLVYGDTSPSKREWQGLTDDEFRKAVDGLEDLEDCWVALEHALKEKNT